MSRKINSKADLNFDRRNANSGSVRGNATVAESLARYGAGRSILVDREGRVIAGNTTLANWEGEVEVVQSSGEKLVVVQRTDLDLESDREARELAHADNRTNQLGYSPNVNIIDEDILAGNDLGWLFREDELEVLRGITPSDPSDDPPVGDFDKVPRNSGNEIVVVFNTEEEMRKGRKEIQDLGYFVK